MADSVSAICDCCHPRSQRHETFELAIVPGESQNEHDLVISIKVFSIEGGKKRVSNWKLDKFYMRYFMMRTLHMDFVSKECKRNIRALDKMHPPAIDPFHDPRPDLVVGRAMVYLNALSHICPIAMPIRKREREQ